MLFSCYRIDINITSFNIESIRSPGLKYSLERVKINAKNTFIT